MKIVGKKKLIKKNFQFRRPRGGPPPDPLAGIRAEIAILKKLDHPNVVKLVEVLEDTNEDDLILVFEYIKNGAIMGEITVENKFTETECQQHFIDLILGLEYLHSRKIVHRDIKPENLLLDNTNTLKIADFGVSEEWTDNDAMLKKSAGTPAFLAPETLNGTSFGGKAIDIWAAGVTLYCMIYGRVPFKGRTITDLHEKILTREVKFPEDIPISHDLKDLLTQLLDKNPETRIKIPQIRSHPWFVNTTRQIPSQEENCQGDIDVTDEDIKEALQEFQTPIHILVMIKNMAKKKSLRNPFVPGIDASLSPASSPRMNDNRLNKHKLFSNKTIPHISISADDDNEDITNT
jgi:[calcium/calmodulin-dependent protein kinase] kinase